MDNDDIPELDPEDFGGHEALGGMAKMGLTIYRALKRDGAQEHEAFTVTAAYFAGMTKAMYTDDGDD